MSERYDTNFSFPSVDDDPETELGVLLMGLGPERLLAGIGVACHDPAATPVTVTLLVDQLRHGVHADLTFAGAVAAGARRWLTAAAGFSSLNRHPRRRSAALRTLWKSAVSAVDSGWDAAPQLRTGSAAERVYLAACWLRQEEIARIMEEPCPT